MNQEVFCSPAVFCKAPGSSQKGERRRVSSGDAPLTAPTAARGAQTVDATGSAQVPFIFPVNRPDSHSETAETERLKGGQS
jgi:hypothetical protein